MQDAVPGTDLLPCAECQPNSFSSFEGDASQTDRHTANLTSRT